MKVSVIIPAYNAARTLSEALDSVCAQTMPDWEVIVINDGSGDSTGAVARSFAAQDVRIRVIDQPNAGEAAARNTGIRAAAADWLVFLDADDWIAPEHLARMTAAVDHDRTLDAVHCGWVRVAADGTEIAEPFRPPAGDLFPTLARRAAFAVHACMVRRALINEISGFDPALKKSPDWDLWQRVARAGANFGSIPEVLAYYRMTPSSASLHATEMLRDGLTILRRGRSADPRVPRPKPEYALGIDEEAAPNQEYYLLCWCAGIQLGTERDARCLLSMVEPGAAPKLEAKAVAQCIFGAATLPACAPSASWYSLLPRIETPLRQFLESLEAHSKTAGLAAASSNALKFLVISNSPLLQGWARQATEDLDLMCQAVERFTESSAWLERDRDRWRAAAEAVEQQKAAVDADFEELAAENARALEETRTRSVRIETRWREALGLLERAQTQHAELANRLVGEGKRSIDLENTLRRQAQIHELELAQARRRIDNLELEAAGARAETAALQQDAAIFRDELARWQRSASDRAALIEEIQQDRWNRLGLRIGAMRRREVPPATLRKPPARRDPEEPAADPAQFWRLRLSNGCDAQLIFPDEDHAMVQVDILKAPAREGWSIQLNRMGLECRAGFRYAVEFQARARRTRKIGVGFARDHEPWTSLGPYSDVLVGPEWQTFTNEFAASSDDGHARIHFDLGGDSSGVDLTGVVLRQLDHLPETTAASAARKGTQ